MDYFQSMYSDPLLNGLTFGCFLLTILGIVFLCYVVWFERNGLAGPYRTLVNQLAAFNILQVVKKYSKH